MVRYHSLVIDAETLPKELIPIAWSSSTGTLPYLGNQNSDVTVDGYKSRLNQQPSDRSVLEDFRNGDSWLSGDAEETRSKEVLMGIRHHTWPHYGLQVLVNFCSFFSYIGFLYGDELLSIASSAVSPGECSNVSREANF